MRLSLIRPHNAQQREAPTHLVLQIGAFVSELNPRWVEWPAGASCQHATAPAAGRGKEQQGMSGARVVAVAVATAAIRFKPRYAWRRQGQQCSN